MIYEGRLTEISEKHGKSAKGPWTLYKLVVSDSQGTHYLGAGFDKPKAPVGAIIRVEANENDKGFLDANLNTLEVLKGEEAKGVDAPSQESAVNSVNKKERSIITQVSYKVAVEAVNGMLANGTITAKASSKAKEDDAFDLYVAALDKVAQHVFDKCMNPLELSNNNEEEEGNDEGSYDPTA